MKREWRKYNEALVKRGEILISPEIHKAKGEERKGKKKGRPYVYPEALIRTPIFLKYAIRLPYRQTQGLAEVLLSPIGIRDESDEQGRVDKEERS